MSTIFFVNQKIKDINKHKLKKNKQTAVKKETNSC